MTRTRRNPNQHHDERGSVLAVSTVGMLAFLLATAMCVDIGHFYLVKNELQNAADAAALAGATALNSSSLGIATAQQRATAAMNNYEFNKKNVSIPPANVEFAVNLDGPYVDKTTAQGNAANIRFVRVKTAASPVKVFFASMILGGTRELAAEAVAGRSVPITDPCDFLPVFVIDYGTPISPGNLYTFRSGTTVAPGNYQILAVAGRGGQDVRVGIASGVDECAGAGAVYSVDTKPGMTSGPVRVGVNTRFDEYQTSQVNPSDQPPDTNVMEDITYDEYKEGVKTKAPSHPGVAGRRVVIIPIVKENQVNNGRDEVTFDRFGLFFLRRKVGGGNGGELQAEYIDDTTVVGRGIAGDGTPAANGLLAKPVLYR